MKELTINELRKVFNEAKEVGANYVAIAVDMPGFRQPEVIINPDINIDAKLEYYEKAYDENLNHRHSKDIKIVGCAYGMTFIEIEIKLSGLEGKIKYENR